MSKQIQSGTIDPFAPCCLTNRSVDRIKLVLLVNVFSCLVLLSSKVIAIDFAVTAVEISDHEIALEQLETELGRHNFDLVEPLIQLAASQTAGNRFEDADASLDRAIQITRYSHGLFTQRQYDLLQLMVENNTLRKNWKAVNEDLKYIGWLYFERYKGSNIELIDRAKWLSDIHLQVALENQADTLATHLIAATTYKEIAVQICQLLGETDNLAYAELLYSLAQNYYIEAKAIENGGRASYYLRLINPVAHLVDSRAGSVDKRYRFGLEKLEMIRDLVSNSSTFNAEAEALVELYIADWKLLFNQNMELSADYVAVHEQLLDSGIDQSYLEAFFSSPILLPRAKLNVEIKSAMADIKGIQQPNENSYGLESNQNIGFAQLITCTELDRHYTGLAREHIDISLADPRLRNLSSVRFSLTLDPSKRANGWLNGRYERNRGAAIELIPLEGNSDTDDANSLLMTKIRSLKFRPALLDGVPSVSDVILDYRLAKM